MVAGATIFAFFGCHSHCLIKGEYTVVRPALRRNGIATSLCNARSVIATRDATDFGYQNGVDFSIITSNFADPTSSFDRERSLWSRLGFRTIRFPLVQLPLWEGGDSCDELKLYFKGHSSRFINRAYIRSGEMRDVITAVNHFRYTAAKAEQYPKYLSMLELLNARTKFSLL
jgi:hypothetical protein